nr:unnamed protein product [Digitaria exilis]
MSAGAGAGGHGGLYGDPAAVDHFAAAFDDHDDGFFFQRSPPCAGEARGGGDGLVMTPYSSITDYLQGFLDPAGMAAHLDAPCRAGDDPVKQEMEARLSRRHERDDGPAAAGAPATPNSSVLSSSSGEAAGADEEPRRRGCKKGRLEEEEGSADAADRNCK